MNHFESITVWEIQRKLYAMDTKEKRLHGCRINLLRLFQKILDTGNEKSIEDARFSLARYFYYCDKSETEYEPEAVREIVRDILDGLCLAYGLQKDMEQSKYAIPYQATTVHFLSRMFQRSRAKGRTPVIA